MSTAHGATRVTLHAGPDRVTVDPAWGGMLTSLVAGGAERLRQPRSGEEAPAEALPADAFPMWGSFVMAPWVGRLRDAVVPWRGTRHQLPRTWRQHAIHGLVAGLAWTVDRVSTTAVELSCVLPDEWPFGGVVRQRVELRPGAATLVLRIEASGAAMPAAVGWHPWFRRPDEGDLVVELTADGVLALDEDLLPSGRVLALDERTDLRAGRATRTLDLDTPYVGVRPPVCVTWPELELRVGIDAPSPCIVVYTGDPASICVEPQSAWPDAPALAATGIPGTGLAALEVGGILEVASRWEWG